MRREKCGGSPRAGRRSMRFGWKKTRPVCVYTYRNVTDFFVGGDVRNARIPRRRQSAFLWAIEGLLTCFLTSACAFVVLFGLGGDREPGAGFHEPDKGESGFYVRSLSCFYARDDLEELRQLFVRWPGYRDTRFFHARLIVCARQRNAVWL